MTMTDRRTDRADRASGLAVVMSGHSTRARIRLVGELDLGTAPRLRTAVEQVAEAGYRHLTVELSGLEFLSAAGLNVLLDADRACRARSGWLVLAHPTAQVRRLLQITDLDTTLTVHPTRDDTASRRDRCRDRRRGERRDAVSGSVVSGSTVIAAAIGENRFSPPAMS